MLLWNIFTHTRGPDCIGCHVTNWGILVLFCPKLSESLERKIKQTQHAPETNILPYWLLVFTPVLKTIITNERQIMHDFAWWGVEHCATDSLGIEGTQFLPKLKSKVNWVKETTWWSLLVLRAGHCWSAFHGWNVPPVI